MGASFASQRSSSDRVAQTRFVPGPGSSRCLLRCLRNRREQPRFSFCNDCPGRGDMAKRAAVLAMAASLLLSAAEPVLAAQQVYVYAVMHPSYGRIGTRTDTI